jgi:hypothetical protein
MGCGRVTASVMAGAETSDPYLRFNPMIRTYLRTLDPGNSFEHSRAPRPSPSEITPKGALVPEPTDLVDVFRVEHRETRDGPYTVDVIPESFFDMYDAHDDRDGHPNANHDPLLGYGVRKSRHFFGFASTQQLTDWFDGWADLLQRHGFHVATYRLHRSLVIEGRWQVLFEREAAALITTAPIRRFCKGRPA